MACTKTVLILVLRRLLEKISSALSNLLKGSCDSYIDMAVGKFTSLLFEKLFVNTTRELKNLSASILQKIRYIQVLLVYLDNMYLILKLILSYNMKNLKWIIKTIFLLKEN